MPPKTVAVTVQFVTNLNGSSSCNTCGATVEPQFQTKHRNFHQTQGAR